MKAHLADARGAAQRAAQREQAARDELDAHRRAGGATLLAALADELACEVCQAPLWEPAALRCGHAFCAPCLQAWFRSAQAKHLAAHPAYSARARVALPPGVALAGLLHPTSLAALAAEAARLLPQPAYACPACRTPVRQRPAPDFVLKRAAHTVAAAAGEAPPPPPPPPRRPDPWDEFWGPEDEY
jgi:hypothetical protein